MDRQFINKPSGFSIADQVIVSMAIPEPNKNGRFHGFVYSNEMLAVNPASGPFTDRTEYIYVSFNDPAAYDMWLMRGSPVVCMMNNESRYCTIETVAKNSAGIITSVDVSISDSNYSVSLPHYYTVNRDNIMAMLVWRVAYAIEAAV